MDAQGCPPSAPGVVLKSSWGSPGTLQSAPGLLWDTFWGAWVCNLELLGMMFVLPGSLRGKNSEKLEFDDRFHEHARFLRSQGLQHAVKIERKRAEERKKSRERREKRKKYADECLGSARERSRARRRPPRVPRRGGGGSPPARPDVPSDFLGFGLISGPDGSET